VAALAVSAAAIDLDAVLGDTRPLWEAFLADAARRYASIAPLDVESLPPDRGEAAATLDRWAASGVGDWRGALERFAEDHAPVYLRPNAEVAAALRAFTARGARVGVFTDAPEELARIALDHLGASRRVEMLEGGSGARQRVLERLGPDATVVGSREDLVRIGESGT
jgi:phosphoglycolate phosphatase-like HAD superfamily hydrolase